MKEIELTQGKFAFVDGKDFNFINSFKWYAKESGQVGSGNWYAVRKESINKKSMRGLKNSAKKKNKDNRKCTRMHSTIMNPPEGMLVHHKNGNGLDNQRFNLENVSILENQQHAAAKTNEKKVEDCAPF